MELFAGLSQITKYEQGADIIPWGGIQLDHWRNGIYEGAGEGEGEGIVGVVFGHDLRR
jgi:hypothetical protein